MSPTRYYDPKSPMEPETESRCALVEWLGAAPGTNIAFLADACGVGEETVVAFVERRARPEPESQLANLIAIATAGAVPSFGWSTEDEFEVSSAARERAKELAAERHASRKPRSRRPASRPLAVRRRRPRGSSTPRSRRAASSGARRAAPSARDAPLEPPPSPPLVDDQEPPPSTERSDPPTLPSSSIPPLPREAAAGAIVIVAVGAPQARAGADDCGDAVSPRAAAQGTIALADAIEALTQQGYSIRLERKE
jgi:hypothetical protein